MGGGGPPPPPGPGGNMGPPPGGGGGNRPTCCVRNAEGESADSFGDCDLINSPYPGGPAIDAIVEFMKDDNIWVASYVEAWGIATMNGLADGVAIGSGNGLSDFQETVEEETECEANLNECFYVPFLDILGCFFSYLGDLFNC